MTPRPDAFASARGDAPAPGGQRHPRDRGRDCSSPPKPLPRGADAADEARAVARAGPRPRAVAADRSAPHHRLRPLRAALGQVPPSDPHDRPHRPPDGPRPLPDPSMRLDIEGPGPPARRLADRRAGSSPTSARDMATVAMAVTTMGPHTGTAATMRGFIIHERSRSCYVPRGVIVLSAAGGPDRRGDRRGPDRLDPARTGARAVGAGGTGCGRGVRRPVCRLGGVAGRCAARHDPAGAGRRRRAGPADLSGDCSGSRSGPSRSLTAPALLAALTEDIMLIANALVGVPQLCINVPIVVACLAYVGWLSADCPRMRIDLRGPRPSPLTSSSPRAASACCGSARAEQRRAGRPLPRR